MIMPGINHFENDMIDARHEKTDIKIFVVVIPKEGLTDWVPTKPSLGMTLTTEYNL